MLKGILIASAGLLLLGACQQQPQGQAVASPPPPPQRNFTVFFDTNQSTLSAESSATVAQAASAFKAGGGRSVAVTGHTDTVGAPDYNLQLSRQRAASVGSALQRGGVPGDAIAALGYGEENLPVPTAQNVADRRNRSVDIVITDRTAAALMSDTDYCKALSRTYRRYRPDQIDEAAATAMSQCETANAVSAIPVLERALTAQKLPLPARTLPRA